MKASVDVRRILVALDDSAPSQAALDAAAKLAEQLGAELEGLFVQDLELLHLAELPLASEIGLASASRRNLDSAGVERAWRAQEARLRVALDSVGLRYRVRTSLRVTRGRVTAELLQAALKADLLAMGTMGQMESTGRRMGSTLRAVTAQTGCPLLLLRSAAPGTRILVLYDGSQAAERAIEWAEHLVQPRSSEITILLPDADQQALRERVQEQLHPDTAAHIEAVTEMGLKAWLQDRRFQIAIVPHHMAVLDEGGGMLSDFRVPVLITR